MTENTNPLGKYYRQPQIYIRLPSRGKYYPADVFTPTETGEIPVLPMTAKDELSFKTPDAMMSGQSTVDVIQSCVSSFKNAWEMGNFDPFPVVLAIRVGHNQRALVIGSHRQQGLPSVGRPRRSLEKRGPRLQPRF